MTSGRLVEIFNIQSCVSKYMYGINRRIFKMDKQRKRET